MVEEIKEPKKIDVLKHFLVPEHQILTKEEVQALLERYNISPLQLPVLLSSDPIAKAIGAKPGDIVKIIRKSPTGKYPYYRRVA
ncbi:MAG: DNA-directed RNA polymerase subunit H [Candidatus Nanoarchaeia archaeon]